MNAGGHQPVQIPAHCEQLELDTIGGSFWFYILLTHAHLQKHYRPFKQPPLRDDGSARDMAAT